MELFSVFGRLRLDDGEFKKGIAAAEGRGKGLGDVMADVGKAVVESVAAMGAALAEIGVAAALTRAYQVQLRIVNRLSESF